MLHARYLTYSVHILPGISVVHARAHRKSLKPNVALSAEALVGRVVRINLCQESCSTAKRRRGLSRDLSLWSALCTHQLATTSTVMPTVEQSKFVHAGDAYFRGRIRHAFNSCSYTCVARQMVSSSTNCYRVGPCVHPGPCNTHGKGSMYTDVLVCDYNNTHHKIDGNVRHGMERAKHRNAESQSFTKQPCGTHIKRVLHAPLGMPGIQLI